MSSHASVTRVLTGRLSNELHPGGYLLAAEERRDENVQELNVRMKYLWQIAAEEGVKNTKQISFGNATTFRGWPTDRCLMFNCSSVLYIWSYHSVIKKEWPSDCCAVLISCWFPWYAVEVSGVTCWCGLAPAVVPPGCGRTQKKKSFSLTTKQWFIHAFIWK